MHKIFHLPLLAAVALLLTTNTTQAGGILAYVQPIPAQKIDGNLSDWPNLPIQPITHHYMAANSGDNDFHANFKVGYDAADGSLYIGIEVQDDHHVVPDENAGYMGQDGLILYLDPQHDKQGGASTLFTLSEKHKEVSHQPATWDPAHQNLGWENVTYAVKRKGDLTTYEWKITLGEPIRPNRSLGLDFFVVDVDPDQDEQAILLWNDGFGKSRSSMALGELLLLPEEAAFGTLTGKIKGYGDEVPMHMDKVRIASANHEALWLDVGVQDDGSYEATLPAGAYSVSFAMPFNSPLFTSDFKQDSRPLLPGLPEVVRVKTEGSTYADGPVYSPAPRPAIAETMPGVLMNKKFKGEEVDEFIKIMSEFYGIPALSVALIKDGKVVYTRTQGVINQRSQVALTEQHLFEAASISKSVFAVMVLRMYERGEIDLDKPLHEYLPFPNLEGDARYQKITARLVLNHQSGLPNWGFGGPGAWESGEPGTLLFDPGTEFGYSGEAFNYLGRVVEKISGKTLPEIYQEEVAQPFGLENTYYNYTDDLEDKIAIGHYQSFPNFKGKEYMPSPASSVLAEAVDFTHFPIGLMNEQHLSQESYALIYQPYTVLTPEQRIYDPTIPQHVSYGFFVQDTKHGPLIAHGGNNGDFDCKFAYFRDSKTGYVVFTNSNLGDEFARDLELFLLGEK